VQHLSMFDYLRVSTSMKDRVIEYVDHLHEHFLDPVMIRKGRYMPPRKPGYSIEIYPESLARFTFPGGAAWTSEVESEHVDQRAEVNAVLAD